MTWMWLVGGFVAGVIVSRAIFYWRVAREPQTVDYWQKKVWDESLNLADLEHHLRKWSFSMAPSEIDAKERAIARQRAVVEECRIRVAQLTEASK